MWFNTFLLGFLRRLISKAHCLTVISRIPDLRPIIFPRLIRTFGCPIHVSSTHPDPCTSVHPYLHVHVQIPYPSQLACIIHPCPIALMPHPIYPCISSGPYPIWSDPMYRSVSYPRYDKLLNSFPSPES
ncbi:hypothetical protein BDR06DRAFT_962509 [Suillus hirtellus]|nr:hypothetical protein BDR06DRAFT_962509 [Suillus hirtellus]